MLINGSFEDGPSDFGGSSFITLPGGSTLLPGWTVTGGSVDYAGPGWLASDGDRAIDLDGAFATGGIMQSFMTSVGSTYQVDFDLSGNPEGPPMPIKNVGVTVAGFADQFAFDASGMTRGTLIWSTISFNFTATNTLSTLAFSSLSPSGNSWGALIDNVSVDLVDTPPAPVPEPSTLLLISLGAIAVAFSRRRPRFMP